MGGFRALCFVENNLVIKSVGERAAWWRMERRKSALAFDQPQEFCDSFTTKLRRFNMEITPLSFKNLPCLQNMYCVGEKNNLIQTLC